MAIRFLTPLPHDNDSFRIVTVSPSVEQAADIHCTLQTVRTSHAPQYEALSHRWQDDSSHVIYIDGFKVLVRRNLALALQALRHSQNPRCLWIDALCIDQDNAWEKGFQVPMMRQIYGASARVIVWLGESSNSSRAAFKAVRSKTMRYSRSMTELLQRSWFGRIWMVQEVALAPSATFCCGSDCIEWTELVRIVDLVGDRGGTVNLGRDSDGKHLHPAFYPRVMDAARKRMKEGNAFELLEALRWFQPFGATDPRDKIYGIIGLLKDPSGLDVDYERPIAALYQDIAIYLIRKTSRLDFLIDSFQKETAESLPELPSWVPNWSDTNQPFNEYICLANNAEIFSASHATLVDPPLITSDSLALYAQTIGHIAELGLFIPTVQAVRKQYWPSKLPSRNIIFAYTLILSIFDSWKSVAAHSIPDNTSLSVLYPTNETLFNVFHATMNKFSPSTADREEYRAQEKWVATVELCLSFFAFHKKYVADPLPWLLAFLCSGPMFMSFSVYVAYKVARGQFSLELSEKQERDASRGSAVFGRLETGLVGLFPAPSIHSKEAMATRVRDRVVLFKGAGRPFVVRRVLVHGESEDGEERWRLVGDAYVHGIMHGGAWMEQKCSRMWLQ